MGKDRNEKCCTLPEKKYSSVTEIRTDGVLDTPETALINETNN